MNMPKPLYALTGVLILAGVLAGCATTGSDDAKITANVQAELAQHPDLGAPNSIDVQTQDHVVYLNGIVRTGLQRNFAGSVASQTPDVAKVQNLVSITK
jgi:osmotically-inducible protein OsmY